MANNLIKGDLLNLHAQRKIAKIGAGVSLGIATLTAFGMRSRFTKGLHIASGVALVGFSIYHYGLYNDGVFQRLLIERAKRKRADDGKDSQNFKNLEAQNLDKSENLEPKILDKPKRGRRPGRRAKA